MSPGRHAVIAGTVFDGQALLPGPLAVVIDGISIAGIVPPVELPAGLPRETLPEGAWLAPGFIDTQVNGGGDVLFNDDPTPEGIAAIARAHRRFGTTSLLPTLITDARPVLEAGLAAVRAARLQQPGILGIHLEGPFLSPRKPGVHAPAHIRRPDPGDLERIGAPEGVTLVTLAPEEVPDGFVRALRARGVLVSLGHSMAGYDEARAAFAEGVTGLTHLFNAMPGLESRAPGPIAAALENPDCSFGLILDGIHVHPAMARLAFRGRGRAMLVTDAMPSVGGERDGFSLYGAPITVRNGRCERADGTLAGAHLDMAGAVRNAVAMLGVDLPQALAMASAAPARFLGLEGVLGRIAADARADLVALMPDTVTVLRTWVAGRPPDPA